VGCNQFCAPHLDSRGGFREHSSMTRSELIEQLGRRFPQLGQDDTKQSVAILLDAITGTLVQGSRAEIRGFGSFDVALRQPRIGRNPKTGEKVEVPSKKVPHFKPGKELRERVDL
jgi:integration host factor subunit beta